MVQFMFTSQDNKITKSMEYETLSKKLAFGLP